MAEPESPMQLLLLTGMSGSGKSIALNALEDLGYYCVDNLPAKLLPEVVEYLRNSGHVHVAISIDVRARNDSFVIVGLVSKDSKRVAKSEEYWLCWQSEGLPWKWQIRRRLLR